MLLDQDVIKAINQYISDYGFGDKKPQLSCQLSADIFRQHYYDKKELIHFCRSMGIPTSGLKNELTQRIDVFLSTGQVMPVTRKRQSSKPDSESGLALDKKVFHYRSDLVTRRFLQKHVPNFTGFSALLQKKIRLCLDNNEQLTYLDVIEMYKNLIQSKSKTSRVAHDSCQYNQFCIDYSQDSSAKIHAIQNAWLFIRDTAGDKTYLRYKCRMEEIYSFILNQQN